mmetsp:Transcript_80722/g.159935  ORF Transcript_80722/g.159935 Transcript_80722/m.159935 type:complete len:277 (-) Transcript_80722:833-1663(-)
MACLSCSLMAFAKPRTTAASMRPMITERAKGKRPSQPKVQEQSQCRNLDSRSTSCLSPLMRLNTAPVSTGCQASQEERITTHSPSSIEARISSRQFNSVMTLSTRGTERLLHSSQPFSDELRRSHSRWLNSPASAAAFSHITRRTSEPHACTRRPAWTFTTSPAARSPSVVPFSCPSLPPAELSAYCRRDWRAAAACNNGPRKISGPEAALLGTPAAAPNKPKPPAVPPSSGSRLTPLCCCTSLATELCRASTRTRRGRTKEDAALQHSRSASSHG